MKKKKKKVVNRATYFVVGNFNREKKRLASATENRNAVMTVMAERFARGTAREKKCLRA